MSHWLPPFRLTVTLFPLCFTSNRSSKFWLPTQFDRLTSAGHLYENAFAGSWTVLEAVLDAPTVSQAQFLLN